MLQSAPSIQQTAPRSMEQAGPVCVSSLMIRRAIGLLSAMEPAERAAVFQHVPGMSMTTLRSGKARFMFTVDQPPLPVARSRPAIPNHLGM